MFVTVCLLSKGEKEEETDSGKSLADCPPFGADERIKGHRRKTVCLVLSVHYDWVTCHCWSV